MKASIIYNPVAGQRSYLDEVRQAAEFLATKGWEIVAVEETRGAGDATTYAREAAAHGYDAVFLAGGDGTIAQTVDGLVGTGTALAVLPTGTGNVFARQLHMPVPGGLHPRPILEAARLLSEGQIRPVDVGRITPRQGHGPSHHFLCWGGVGFDAEVSLVVAREQERKKRLGIVAFLAAGFFLLRHYAGTAAIVRVDGRRIGRRMIMLVANNIQLYGVFVRMAPTALLDDGRLDVVCFLGNSPLRTALHAVRAILGLHIGDPKVEIYQAQRVEVNTYRPLPVHVDGDAIGYTPVIIEVVPRALKLLVPSCAPANLFSDGANTVAPQTPWEWVTHMAHDAHTAIWDMR
ncbi:MAG: diacylglycerol kinase family lipid kinase [Anaerolineae bacterium]|nr:diacylglycerol kinase family lipid kinase [Anaerolineae bacterium]